MDLISGASINRAEDDDIESNKESEKSLTDGTTESSRGSSVSSFRRIIPQVIATTVQSLLLLALGMMVACPTVIIAALHRPKSELPINDSQASWFAGILLICQPVGSILSGILQEWCGRKKCMLFVNIPQIVGWYLIYRAESVDSLLVAASLLGMSVGFMEAPTLSYVGEIAQPHLRGTLASFTSTYVSAGFFVMYLLGTVATWRMTALMSCTVPVISFLCIMMIPDSPIWLLNKGRKLEAEKSLCWLRGWVTPQEIEREFSSMIRYCEDSKKAYNLQKATNNTPYTLVSSSPDVITSESRLNRFFRDLIRPEIMRPLRLVVSYFFFYHCSSLSGFRPYMVNTFTELNMPINPHYMTIISAICQLTGGFCCMALVHKTGKRVLSLVSMSACVLACFSIGAYILLHKYQYVHQPWIPTILFICLFFCTNLGVSPIPWTLLAEVFPTRGRGIGGGLSAACYYIEFFLVSKTFLQLQSVLALYGVCFFYGGLGVVGIIYLYFCLPETEGKRLDEVEKFFKSNNERNSTY
ncbi:facilitated trehalose transporter Tret1-2 homolog isoform X1 [Nilaparvata lugens]|uniref:Sugar transporter n=2 Tax=Nilaparvata lugens TaxID=108931 RepID=A0A0A8J8M1_NILLU|nr:facilitated trehalose transporter Tret1-2 homolog isoform X1 [Nilaparvata lugens]BAQ02359.1 sugar transporter [Nilaparvata lugens]